MVAETGDVAWQAEQAWLKAYAGTDEFAKEVTARRLRALRQDLNGPDPTPLERLLVARIALCQPGEADPSAAERARSRAARLHRCGAA